MDTIPERKSKPEGTAEAKSVSAVEAEAHMMMVEKLHDFTEQLLFMVERLAKSGEPEIPLVEAHLVDPSRTAPR